MRTKEKVGIAVLVAAVAAAMVGCPSPLKRKAAEGDKADTACVHEYYVLFSAYVDPHPKTEKPYRVKEEDYQKGRKLFADSRPVAQQLKEGLQRAKAEGDFKLDAPGRCAQLDELIGGLRRATSEIKAVPRAPVANP